MSRDHGGVQSERYGAGRLDPFPVAVQIMAESEVKEEGLTAFSQWPKMTQIRHFLGREERRGEGLFFQGSPRRRTVLDHRGLGVAGTLGV